MHPLITAVPALGPDIQGMLESWGDLGFWIVVAIIFAECGLLIGFFLPGDSLLFTAGLLVATGFIDTPIAVVAALITVAAIVGNLTGYWIGHRFGPAVFAREESRFFRPEYVHRTKDFFDRYGARAIVLARFVPIVRTFITVMAGAVRMDFRVYTVYSVLGGILWGVGLTVAGYYLGTIPVVKDNIELIVIGMVLVSVVPIWFELRRHRRAG